MSINARFPFFGRPSGRSGHGPLSMPSPTPMPMHEHGHDHQPDPMPDSANCFPPRNNTLRLDDWMALFEAVKSRLLATAVAGPRTTHKVQWLARPDGVVLRTPPRPSLQAELQDCVRALDQLQHMLPQLGSGGARVGNGNGIGNGIGNSNGNGSSNGSGGQDKALLMIQSALARSQQDLAQAQAAAMQASHRALHDGLTALPNRDNFRQRLDQALGQPGFAPPGPTLAVLFLDLDGLKLINDGHGHATGDELLRIVAARLARSVRAQDMVCRLGGDEFACLLGNVFNRDQLSHLACKLFDAVSAPLKIGELELTVRPSIGIAVCPTDGNNCDALLRHADSAMYRAKRQQLGYAFFDANSDR